MDKHAVSYLVYLGQPLTNAFCVSLWLGFETSLLGACIIFAKCVSYSPNRDSMHNDNILK